MGVMRVVSTYRVKNHKMEEKKDRERSLIFHVGKILQDLPYHEELIENPSLVSRVGGYRRRWNFRRISRKSRSQSGDSFRRPRTRRHRIRLG